MNDDDDDADGGDDGDDGYQIDWWSAEKPATSKNLCPIDRCVNFRVRRFDVWVCVCVCSSWKEMNL